MRASFIDPPRMVVPSSARRLRLCLGALVVLGCGATVPGGGESAGAGDHEGSAFFEGGSSIAGSSLFNPNPALPPGQSTAAQACITQAAPTELVQQPVDIILLLDNSVSMAEEAQATEDNINEAFSAILAESEIDYRVILISHHRQEPRDANGQTSTSVCVKAPLSGLLDCSEAPDPVFSERFFQYSTKLESRDSLGILLDTYEPPFDLDHWYVGAPNGWSEWLRPSAKKVFLQVADDDADMPVETFLSELAALAPRHFDQDWASFPIVFHSIVGLAEKERPTDPYHPLEPLQTSRCRGNGGKVASAGLRLQELSQFTGGLRFPICQYDNYDVVFRTIADDVVYKSQISCELSVPEPPGGKELDLANVAISFTPTGGRRISYWKQVPERSRCVNDAFYIAGQRLYLCPEACGVVRQAPRPEVEVLFTCESQLLR